MNSVSLQDLDFKSNSYISLKQDFFPKSHPPVTKILLPCRIDVAYCLGLGRSPEKFGLDQIIDFTSNTCISFNAVSPLSVNPPNIKSLSIYIVAV